MSDLNLQKQIELAAIIAGAMGEAARGSNSPRAVPEMLVHAGFNLIEAGIGIEAMPDRLRAFADEIERQMKLSTH